MRFFSHCAAAACCAVLLGSCGQSSVSWTENVRSADGQLLILRRTTAFRPGGNDVADVTIEVPGQAPVWRSTRYTAQGHPELPLVFNMEDNTPTIYTTLGGIGACGTYYRYQLTRHAWRQAPTSETMDQPTNLLLNVERRRPHVTLADKAVSLRDGRYAQVLRHVAPGACPKPVSM